MTNHCWHETETALSQYLSHSRKVICCNCNAHALRIYKYESTKPKGHGKYYTTKTLVPQPVKCDKECKDD